MTTNTTIKDFPATSFISVRHVGSYSECNPTWEKLIKFAKENNLFMHNTRFFGIGHDNPHEVKKCRYDACISIADDFDKTTLPKDFTLQNIETRKSMTAIHKGSCEAIRDLYKEFYTGEPSKQNEINLELPPIEVYLNNPNTTPEDELLTEVYVPIK